MTIRFVSCPRENPQAGAYYHLRDCAYQVLALLQEREIAHADRWVPEAELASYLSNLNVPSVPKALRGSAERVSLLHPLLRFLEDRARLEARFDGEKAWYRSKPMHESYAKMRYNHYEKARGAGSVLDRTFYAVCFNQKHGTYHGCEIDPAALSPHESVATLNDAIDRSRSLLAFNAYVGAAFHHYENEPLTFDEAKAKLERDHPGFCQDAYDIAIDDSIRGMR